jgi:surface antigen
MEISTATGTVRPGGRRRRLTGLMVAPVFLAGVAVLGVGSAAQAVTGYHTAFDAVRVRAGATTQSAQINTIGATGTSIDIACQSAGESVTAVGGTSAVWDKLNGYNGYISDLFVRETPYAQFDSRIARCETPPPSSGRTWGTTESNNSAVPGQCTWGAKYKFWEVTKVYPAIYGNAKDYAKSAQKAGWTIVLDAQPRSIVVFQPGVQGADRTYGHVAWVDSVETRSDGLFVHISEMNGTKGVNNWDQRVVKDVVGMSYILAP